MPMTTTVTVNVADAKRHFADLIGRVAYGEAKEYPPTREKFAQDRQSIDSKPVLSYTLPEYLKWLRRQNWPQSPYWARQSDLWRFHHLIPRNSVI
jgi:hypothetical protein